MKTSIAGSLEDWGGLKEKAGKWPNKQKQRSWSQEVPERHDRRGPKRVNFTAKTSRLL